MLTGVPKNERWFLWVFLAWVFFALGPGLQLASKPVFVGHFPLLYVYCIVMFIISLILCYILGYKLKMTDIPEDFLEAEEEGSYE
jgi:hypothetical protein